MLNPGDIGLIEVPKDYRALRLKRFFEIFPNHINYYSFNSSVALASEAGLNVISCHESFGSDYLELCLRYEPEVALRSRELNLVCKQICDALTGKISNLREVGRSILIWGCVAKTLSILSACSKEKLDSSSGIIDSDTHIHNRFVPNTVYRSRHQKEGLSLGRTSCLYWLCRIERKFHWLFTKHFRLVGVYITLMTMELRLSYDQH